MVVLSGGGSTATESARVCQSLLPEMVMSPGVRYCAATWWLPLGRLPMKRPMFEPYTVLPAIERPSGFSTPSTMMRESR